MFKIDFWFIEFYLSIWNPKNFFDSDCKDSPIELCYFHIMPKNRPATGITPDFGLKHKLA
jgi:hypothetical protein